MSLQVVDGGFFATVQDLGRPGLTSWGVPASGAVDPLSLRAANRLVGNRDGAPAIEVTWRGGAFRFARSATVALGGAPFEARLDGGRSVAPWTPTPVRPGDTLRLGTAAWGLRAYVVVSGGIEVAPVLGSASTHVTAGFGGLAGRALRAGDVLEVAPAGERPVRAALPLGTRAVLEEAIRGPRVRATPGPQEDRFPAESIHLFWGAPYGATDRADRMGIRLDGPRLVARPDAPATSLLTEGVPWGAVQVSGEGMPIVLLADGPTTGGYPVVACAATVDLPRLGQVRPRDVVAFECVTPDAARAAFRERESWLDREVPPP